jgi:putative Mn2+ efflux pump MntP
LDHVSYFLYITLIGISSNFDNITIGFAYGLNNISFPLRINLIINFIGFCFALIGSYFGVFTAKYISPEMAEWSSFFILMGIGILIIYNKYGHRFSSNHLVLKIQDPGNYQGILLGFTLSLTNMAAGYGVAISNHSMVWTTTVSITIWGIIAIWLGNKVGKGKIFRFLNNYSPLIAGLLFIFIAFYQIL